MKASEASVMKAVETLAAKATGTAGVVEGPKASATVKSPRTSAMKATAGVTTEAATVETAPAAVETTALGKSGFRRARERDRNCRYGKSSQQTSRVHFSSLHV